MSVTKKIAVIDGYTSFPTTKSLDQMYQRQVGCFIAKLLPPIDRRSLIHLDMLLAEETAKIDQVTEPFFLALASCVSVLTYDSAGRLTAVSHHNRGTDVLHEIKDEVVSGKSALIVRGPYTTPTQGFLIDGLRSELTDFGLPTDSVVDYFSPNYDKFKGDEIKENVIVEVNPQKPIRLHYLYDFSSIFASEEVQPSI